MLVDLAADPGAGGATILDTRANGSTRLSTFKISPSGDVVKRLYALPYPIPGDRDDPWRTGLFHNSHHSEEELECHDSPALPPLSR
jgi:hypothetical protein